MRDVSRHLFIPRRPLIASMLSSDPKRSWIRIVKASLISSTRPALTSASAPFAMTRRFPLPARRSFASIDRVMGSISGLWLPPPASSAAAIFARFSQMSIRLAAWLPVRQCPGRGFSSRGLEFAVPLWWLFQDHEEKLGLRNGSETKTSVSDARRERFDFLDYAFGPHHFRKDGHWYLGASPSKKSVRRLKQKVGEILVPGNQ